MEEHRKYLIISYVTCIFAQVAFAAYAIVRYTVYVKQRHRDQTSEEFITARGTQTRWRIAWSFFASAVGAWCITAPPAFAVYTGIVGCVMYAVASGLPVLIIAIFGARIQRMHPDVCTMPDYVGKRFGPVARTLVVCISLINMSIVLLAEYTTIGLLFKLFVGSVDYPIVIVVGVLTMMYTAYGGVFVSIITDQAQGIFTSLFIVILVIYTAVTFRPESLPKPLPNDVTYEASTAGRPLVKPETDHTGWPLGANKLGYSAIYSMPCSLMAATVFSEAMWQKVWASTDRRSVIFGGGVGFALTTTAVFLFGFGGWLAAWGGYVTWETDGNLFLFQVFAAERHEGAATGASVQVGSWIGVITLILACTMNESAIDSIQNGITAVLAQHFFKGQHTVFPRLLVVAINVPLIVISLQGYKVLALFLITNTLTTCCFLLLALGLSRRLQGFVTEGSLVFGFCVAMLTVTAYGIGRHWKEDDKGWSVRYGSWYTWYGNVSYDWDYFLVASGFSVIGMLMWAVPAALLRRMGVVAPGLSGVVTRIPGSGYFLGDGIQVDLLTLPCMAWLARLLRYRPDAAAGDSRAATYVAGADAEAGANGHVANGHVANGHVANGNGHVANGNGHVANGNGYAAAPIRA
ncbi:hypothetical protein GPECTOR_11g40 [Gonium pectorale]|uniref:Uncharacterized protein n=1 Tax=Gonium pectorale TaxID=33097 RepID=A0A150GQ46_GONPE|nr:hypothetical protein GPECTOR_11g40 [Gonium pectorale]|eukprot:KXZ51913.1 hypothetical protein GPECTOR_11g40 [Gonium pectorale]